ncbi:hypothetical protein TNCV_2389071 [Trichonephila clavipes]|nr:hypothetical protein TNCV_2389071 [Trichonephila clavipes]
MDYTFRLAIDRENKQSREAIQSDRTSVHIAIVWQTLTTVSSNSNPFIVMLQAEARLVSKLNAIPFRYPCPSFISPLGTWLPSGIGIGPWLALSRVRAEYH